MSAVDAYWAAPPVSRTMTAAAVLISVPTHMMLISGGYIVWITERVLTFKQIPELWRFATSFLLTGGGFSMIMDPYFLYIHGSQLERGSPQFTEPGAFLVYILFVATVILLTAGLMLGGHLFLSPLTVALSYTWCQENPNQQLTYFIVTFSAKYLPYAMLLLTFVMGGPGAALHQATGLVAAHLYLFLTKIWPEFGGGKSPISTPQFIRNAFAGPGGTAQQRSYGTAFSARTDDSRGAGQRPSGNSWSSGISRATGGDWGSRGTGHRLGGD